MTVPPGTTWVTTSVRRWSACTVRARAMDVSSAARTAGIQGGEGAGQRPRRHADGRGPNPVEPLGELQRGLGTPLADGLDDRAHPLDDRVDVDLGAGQQGPQGGGGRQRARAQVRTAEHAARVVGGTDRTGAGHGRTGHRPGGVLGGAETSPRRCAHSAALVRSVTPIWVKTLVRWAFTVRSAMPRRAGDLLVGQALGHQHQHLLLARPDSTDAGAGRARPASTTRAARGSSGDSPRAAARTAPTRPSGSASLSR